MPADGPPPGWTAPGTAWGTEGDAVAGGTAGDSTFGDSTMDGSSAGGSLDDGSLETTGPRYRRLDRLGAGGMGIVDRVRDTLLERDVALKTLRWDVTDRPRVRARFAVESTITAGLEHPAIVPIYDRGRTPDGREWYAMKLLEGRTLAAALAAGLGRRRAVDAVLRIAEAVAYAHARGVVHRDIKPANIMLGAFGEVLLLDWGIARRLGDRPDPAGEPDAPPHETLGTLAGTTLGTLAYAAPEQLRDAASAERPADVFALGVTLYHALHGRGPWSGESGAVLAARMRAPWPEPTAGPEALRELVRAATHPDPEQRPTAADVAEQLRRWSEGEPARIKARSLVEQAAALAPRAEAYQAESQRLRAAAAELLDGVAPNAPVDAKLPGWRREAEADRARREARRIEAERLATLRSALELAPELPEARAALGAYYRERLLAADAAGDEDGVAEHAALLERLDPIANAEWLRGDGRIDLRVDAGDARVEVLRFELRDRRLEPVPTGLVWTAPVVDTPLAMGSYLLRIEAPGRQRVDHPVCITRQGRWRGVRPGGDQPHVIHLPPHGALAADECYVPAGWCLTGGDPQAADGLPSRRVWVDGFVMQRDPVTQGAFIDWLEALRADGRLDEALAHAPLAEDPGPAGRRLFYDRTADGGFALRRAYGMDWAPDWPAVRITWHAAMAYARHLSATTGHRWLLPHSWQWEKAARGVDGRPLPWGAHLDPTWAAMLSSFSGPPSIEPVGARPADVSVYGVRGTTGNVREYCLDLYRRLGPEGALCRPEPPAPGPDDFVVVRGGSHESQPRFCRSAGRFGLKPGHGILSVGFRLARALDPAAAQRLVGAEPPDPASVTRSSTA